MTDKSIVVLPVGESVLVRAGNGFILVKPYLSNQEQEVLVELYLNALFQGTGSLASRIHNAENANIITCLEFCTNLKLVDDSGEELVALVTIDDIFRNFEMWNSIKAEIKNYSDFERRLQMAIESVKEERRLDVALGVRLERIIDKVSETISSLSGENFTDEKLAGVRSLLEEVNKSPILNSALGQASPKKFTPKPKAKSAGKKSK